MAGQILATDLTDAATLSAELGWASNDVRIPRLINVASALATNYLNRVSIITNTGQNNATASGMCYAAGIIEAVRGYRSPRIIVTLTPVISIASISYLGMTQDPTTYELQEPDAGLIYSQTGWLWTGLEKNGMMQEDDVPGSEDRSILVTYTGGWVTPGQIALGQFTGVGRSLPYDIEDAVLQIARDRALHTNTDGSLIHEELGTAKAYYLEDGIRAIPPSAEAMLRPYRRLFQS